MRYWAKGPWALLKVLGLGLASCLFALCLCSGSWAAQGFNGADKMGTLVIRGAVALAFAEDVLLHGAQHGLRGPVADAAEWAGACASLAFWGWLAQEARISLTIMGMTGRAARQTTPWLIRALRMGLSMCIAGLGMAIAGALLGQILPALG